MIKKFSLTGNPWIDNGITRFICTFENQPYVSTVKKLPPATYEMEIKDDKKDKFKEDLISILKTDLEQSYILNKHFKILIKEGLMNSPPNEKDYKFSDDEISVLKNFEKRYKEEKGKTINFNIKEKKAQVRVQRWNVIAPLKEYSERIESIVNSFVEELYSSKVEEECEECPLCGAKVSKSIDILQNINPFVTKHHNKLRGYTGQSGNERGCSICSLFGLFSALDNFIPYVFVDVKNKETFVILPLVKDIEILEKIKKTLNNSLKDFKNKDELNYGTNIKRMLSQDKYSVVVSIYDQMVNKYAEGEEYFENLKLSEEDLSHIYKWVTFNIKSGQAYKMASFSSIKPTDSLYGLVKENDEIEPFSDVFKKISDFCKKNQKDIPFELFSKGIVTLDIGLISEFLFTAYKNRDESNGLYLSNEEGFQYFNNLINKIYGGKKMDKNLIEDAKTFGIHIGNNLTKDIGLMTKLYNVTSKDDLLDVIKESLMKMYKINLKSGNIQIKEDKVATIINSLNEENWKEIANTIFIFAALRSINTKIKGCE